jgi:hypothetical protein
MQRSMAPEICWLDVVVGIRVKAFVWGLEFVELMDDEKDGIQLVIALDI